MVPFSYEIKNKNEFFFMFFRWLDSWRCVRLRFILGFLPSAPLRFKYSFPGLRQIPGIMAGNTGSRKKIRKIEFLPFSGKHKSYPTWILFFKFGKKIFLRRIFTFWLWFDEEERWRKLNSWNVHKIWRMQSNQIFE